MKLLLLVALGLVAVACSNPAAIEPTATVSPPTATPQPTLPPPTETATAVSPTATVERTPLPTANFAPADIVATWTRDDPERGNLFIALNAKGTYAASHGSPDVIIQSGLYELDGRLFTFVAQDGWSGCTGNDATYMLRYTGGGQYLVFEPLADDCLDRVDAFRGFRWDRYIAP